jgi:hypothetical protein
MYYYILSMFHLVMHWINRPLRRAKVDERLSWWSVGQTCNQVPLSTIDKLVVDTKGLLLVSLKRESTVHCTP